MYTPLQNFLSPPHHGYLPKKKTGGTHVNLGESQLYRHFTMKKVIIICLGTCAMPPPRLYVDWDQGMHCKHRVTIAFHLG